MSAEGKKKRGISGAANAKSIPFRYGGSKCDYSTHHGRTDRVNEKFRRTVEFGLDVVFVGLGYSAPVAARLQQLYDGPRAA